MIDIIWTMIDNLFGSPLGGEVHLLRLYLREFMDLKLFWLLLLLISVFFVLLQHPYELLLPLFLLFVVEPVLSLFVILLL